MYIGKPFPRVDGVLDVRPETKKKVSQWILNQLIPVLPQEGQTKQMLRQRRGIEQRVKF
jgi:hypothetical protein